MPNATPSLADGELAAVLPHSITACTYQLDVSTTHAETQLDPGVYVAELKGADASVMLFCKLAPATPTAVVTTTGYAGKKTATFCFRGDRTERFVVTTTNNYLSVVMSSGGAAASLYLTRLA